MPLPIGVLALFSVLGAVGLAALGKKGSAAAPAAPVPDLPPVEPPKPPTAKPPTTSAPPVVYSPPAYVPPAPGSGLTPAGVAFDALGQQATLALRNLGYVDGKFVGPATPESIQAATSLAALMEANGFKAQADQLRAATRVAAATVAVAPCPGVPAILPTAVGTAVCRALNLERDPKVLRGLADALRGLPQSSDPQVVSLIKMLEMTSATLEAQQSEADTVRKIEEVMAAKTPGVMPSPIPTSAYSAPTLPAEIQALVDAALKGMGVSAGVVKGPVTQDALIAARQAAEALDANGYDDLATQMRLYLAYAEKMVGSGAPATTSTATASGGTYVVKSGDTGQSIAKQFTGDVNRWRELAKANPKTTSSARGEKVATWGMVIYAGETLTLPASW